jgi:hypothetical protein
MRANNTRKIDLAEGHFYRMKEKNGKAFVGEYIGQQADEFAFLFPENSVSVYSFRVKEGKETFVCGYTKDHLPQLTKDLGTFEPAADGMSA